MDKSTDKVKLNDELLDQVSGGYEQYWRTAAVVGGELGADGDVFAIYAAADVDVDAGHVGGKARV